MKVSVCLPIHGDTKALFTLSLAKMLMVTQEPGRAATVGLSQLELMAVMGQPIGPAREQLTADALNGGADYILWLDADQVFPPDTLIRLLAHNLPVVGCNYVRRGHPFEATAQVLNKEGAAIPLRTTEQAANAKKLDRAYSMGLGVCLVKADVYRRIEAPRFLFHPTIGEDGFFFRRLWDADIPAYVDHALSWQVGHVGEAVRLNKEAPGGGRKIAAPHRRRR